MHRDRFHLSAFLCSLILTAGFLTIGSGWLPASTLGIFVVIYLLAIAVGYRSRPVPMD
jgi:hypothetical protein